jgi:glycosyltransferase involved in cell wall biosynthesis
LGDGIEMSKIKISLNKNLIKCSISFQGWIYGEDKINYLNNSHIFLLPSYAEGMPNSLLEAMASGLPSIVTDVGSVPELISHLENGFLIEKRNPESIAKAIIYLVENPSVFNNISKNARITVVEKHSLELAAKEFKKIISK